MESLIEAIQRAAKGPDGRRGAGRDRSSYLLQFLAHSRCDHCPATDRALK